MSIRIQNINDTVRYLNETTGRDTDFNKSSLSFTRKTSTGVDTIRLEDDSFNETFNYSEVIEPATANSEALMNAINGFL